MAFKVSIKVHASFIHDFTVNEWLLRCYAHFYDVVEFMPIQTILTFVVHSEMIQLSYFITFELIIIELLIQIYGNPLFSKHL